MNFQHLKKGWRKPIVFRSEIKEFTGGLIGEKYMSVLDCKGQGPLRNKMKGHIYYDVTELVNWMEERSGI